MSDALATWGLGPAGSETARHDILLVTTELLSNAVKAAAAPVVLTVEGHHNRVDISVTDDSPDRAVQLPAGIDAHGGRGLPIIDTLAQHWGQQRLDAGSKQVWAHVPIPAQATLTLDCTHLPL